MNADGGRMRPALASVCLASALLLSNCHKGPPPVVSPPPSASARTTALQRTIDGILAGPELARGTWGIAAQSVTRGDLVYALNAGKLLMPASTLKVVTLAVAADQLGWDFRFRTPVLTTGRIENGILNGDVIIVGSGDPSIDDWDGAGTRLFQEWADALKSAGIHRVLGRIIGDDNVFDDEGLGNGWAWDDLGTSYATSVGGLQFNQNAVRLFVGPGPSAGDRADVRTQPGGARLALVNRVTTVRADGVASLSVRPGPGSALELRGAVRLGAEPLAMNVSVSNPTLYFANAVRDAFIAGGIDVVGQAVDIDDLDPAPDRSGSATIAEHASAPLAELAGTMMRLSQNLYAETLMKTVGAREGGTGSTTAGLAATRAQLVGWGAPPDFVMVDGSGLSRYNLATPAALVSILAHVYGDSKLRDPFLATLPVVGVDGTVAGRMKETAAAGRVRAKSGSFSNARALAGFIDTAGGEPLAFAILANNYGVPAQAIDRATDAVIVALTQFSRR